MDMEIDTTNDEVRCRATLRRSGNSTVLTMPPQILDAAGLELDDDVDVISRVDEDTREIMIRGVGGESAE